jgi:hypothetical protein
MAAALRVIVPDGFAERIGAQAVDELPTPFGAMRRWRCCCRVASRSSAPMTSQFAIGIDLMIRGLDSYLGQQPDKASASRRRRCATPADGQ